MSEHELIAKQQLEIERLNIKVDNYMVAAALARKQLSSVHQWEPSWNDPPEASMNTVVKAYAILCDI